MTQRWFQNANTLTLLVLLMAIIEQTVMTSDIEMSEVRNSHNPGVPGPAIRTLHRLVGGHLPHHHPFFAREGLTAYKDDYDDTELLTSAAGGGKDGDGKDDNGGEEKKTLSQQVADGKYGLIQKELFSRPIKKPGLISYDVNPDIPNDNINNLGGLTKHDIWLAENHLLVIKGGNFPPTHEIDPYTGQSPWQPIDDYIALPRQVKLPAHPKVPPPFPVQLTDDGPLQILGTNYTTTLNGTLSAAPYPLPPPGSGGAPPFERFHPAIGPYPANFTTGDTPFPIPPFPPSGGGNFGPPYPPAPLNVTFIASLPPGAAVLPPPNNLTDPYDEDDPSIYYPPPYSFFYQMENTSIVPPGPLVPGIVLPPPPNFFAPLEKPARRKPIVHAQPSLNQRPYGRPPSSVRVQQTTTTEPIKQILPTTTPQPATPVSIKPLNVNNELGPPSTKYPPRIVTIVPVIRFHTNNRSFVQITTTTSKPHLIDRRPQRLPSVTVLKPIKPSPTPSAIYFFENNEVINNKGKPYQVYRAPTPMTSITTTKVPLKVYFTTPANKDIDSNSLTPIPENNYNRGTHIQDPRTTKIPRQYYYYKEPVTNNLPTQRVPKINPVSDQYYQVPKDYYLPLNQNVDRPPPPAQQQYYYVNKPVLNRPSQQYRFIESTKKPQSDNFNVHVARLKQQIHQYYTTPGYKIETTKLPSPKPVYQFSFQAANYKPTSTTFKASDGNDNKNKFRPINNNKYSVEIQPAIEIVPTQGPIYQNTPSPVYYQQQKRINAERPRVPNVYSAQKPDYEYEEVIVDDRQNRYVATPKPISQYAFEVTQNPLHQPYYTKQDENYFDDITKKYFTIFGKKLPQNTTPLSRGLQQGPLKSRPLQQQQIPYSQDVPLQGDTLVNYLPAQRPPNPQANYLPTKFQPVPKYVPAEHVYYPKRVRQQNRGAILTADRDEIIEAIPVKVAGNDKPGAFISYELPGDDGAHFYFLTPQLAKRRDQGAGFYYDNRPRVERLKRQNDKNDQADEKR